MEQILVVEDERKYRETYKDIFELLMVPEEKVFFANNFEAALRWVAKNVTDLQVALIDLKIPRDKESQGTVAEDDPSIEEESLGFQLIRKIRERNRDCELAIISNYADELPERKVLANLRASGVWVDSVLHKQYDLDMDNNVGLDMLRCYVEPINKELELLEQNGIYARHPRLEKLVRKLKHIYSTEEPSWPAPVLLLHGLPGSGKNLWARAAAILKTEIGEDVVFEQESLGSLPAKMAGDSVAVRLFGSRRYEKTNAAGLFERASRYRNRHPGLLARPVDQPDYRKSGIAFLDELDSAPPGLVDGLLNMMSEGIVKTFGLDNLPIKIGCSLIFASLKGSQLLSDVSKGQLERGEDALEAFFDRIPPNQIIEIPPLEALGSDYAINFLRFRSGRPNMLLQPAAKDLIVEGVSTGCLNTRELCQIRIRETSRRLTYQEVQEVFSSSARQVVGHDGFTERQLLDAREWLEAIQSGAEKAVSHGKRVNKSNVAEYVNSPSKGGAVTGQRLGQVLHKEEYSPALKYLLSREPQKYSLVSRLL